MLKILLCAFFAFVLFSGVSSAQGGRSEKLTNWEFLEISATKYSGGYNQSARRFRDYNYTTSAEFFAGQNSLEWMKGSGWELVSVVNYGEGGGGFFFKRPFVKTRTENEIARLKKDFETEISIVSTPPKSILTDLDEKEFQQKLADFNKNQEVQLRTALEQIKNLPLKIISVESKSSQLDSRLARAELVLDATAVLLKNGVNYRSLEADQYYRETVKQLLDHIGVRAFAPLDNNAKGISKGQTPLSIGKFKNFGSDVYLSISVVVNAAGEQNIVAQGGVQSEWIKK